MKEIATIRAYDEQGGEIITIGIEPATHEDYPDGYRVIASNGHDIGYSAPLSERKCIEDIAAMYEHWDTFCWSI